LCVFCVRFFCFYIVSSETASRPNKRLMRTYHWISLFMSIVSKLAYRIWVILIANKRVKNNNNNSVALVRERSIPTEQLPLVSEVSANFCRKRSGVSAADSYGRNLGFLDRIRYFFFQIAPQFTHETLWTPFQTHRFSENLVMPVIEPGPLDLWPETLDN
jgi:hypothetical protein